MMTRSGARWVAIFDRNDKDNIDEITDSLATVYWEKYEFENYFIFEETIISFFEESLNREYEGLFSPIKNDLISNLKNQRSIQILFI